MCSATSSERTRKVIRTALFLLLTFFSHTAVSFAQQEPSESVPFKLRHAGESFLRTDSSGTQMYILVQDEQDVLITREATTISCDSLTYFPDRGYFNCIGGVNVADTSRSLACDTLVYYVERAYYRAAGNMNWSSEKLGGSGDVGEYWRDRDLFRVTGNAAAADSIRTLHSNTMEYEYTAEILRAEGDVHFSDVESGSEATASSARYDSDRELLVLRGRPVLTYYEEDDSTRGNPYNLTGDVVTSYGQDSLVSVGRVRLWRDSLTVTADSLFHDRLSDMSFFRGGRPLVEHPEYRLSADNLDVLSRDNHLERIEADGGGRGEFGGDSTSLDSAAAAHGSWIEGDTLRLFFSASALDSIYAAGDARSYYQENEQSGINYVQGGVINLIFRDNLLDVVEVSDGGRGVYIPPDSGATITVVPDSAGFTTTRDSVLPR